MREIKFRAWDREKKKMVYEDLFIPVNFDGTLDLAIEYYNGNEKEEFKGEEGRYISPNRFILQQYTGLKDKNGKEIYEGDILWEEPKCVHQRERPRRHSVVVWHNNGWRRSCYNGKYEVHPELCVRELKVIGNIHENPELLEGIE